MKKEQKWQWKEIYNAKKEILFKIIDVLRILFINKYTKKAHGSWFP